MSKGLERVEISIIEALKKYEGLSLQPLTLVACGYTVSENFTRSDYNKVCRAVKSLEKKRLFPPK